MVFFFPVFTFGQSRSVLLQPSLDSTANLTPFAPDIVDTRYDEEASSFSPDNKTVYFAMGSIYSTICFSKNVNGKWVKPRVASFSGKWKEMDPFISPDGKRLFYSSSRPLPNTKQDIPNKHFELWYVDDIGSGNWGKPHHLGYPVNTGKENNIAPSVDSKGTLYWSSWDREVNKSMQSYYSIWLGDHYGQVKLLIINDVSQIQDPFIAANGKYLVFVSGKSLYISMRDGVNWSSAQKLGPPVSMGDDINSPYVSRDGKTLYFTSGRIDGFYKRDPENHSLNFNELIKENDSLFNGSGNIFKVPVNLPDGH